MKNSINLADFIIRAEVPDNLQINSVCSITNTKQCAVTCWNDDVPAGTRDKSRVCAKLSARSFVSLPSNISRRKRRALLRRNLDE